MALLDDQSGGLGRVFRQIECLGLPVDLEPVVADLLLGLLIGRFLHRIVRFGFFDLDLGSRSHSVISFALNGHGRTPVRTGFSETRVSTGGGSEMPHAAHCSVLLLFGAGAPGRRAMTLVGLRW